MVMKRIWLILLFLITCPLAKAQLQNYNWRIGFSVGYTNYYGDLSPHIIQGWDDWGDIVKLYQWNENYQDEWSGQLNLERRLTPTTGLMLQVGRYQFSMSDRYRDPSGNLVMDAPHFDRALNFKTTLWDTGLSLVFKSDNDRLLSSNAFIAPYLTLGLGGLWFDIKGDLLDEEGNRYDYSQPNLITDGIYETTLSDLNTERADGYELESWYSQLGLGVRFKLSKNLELFVQSEFKRAFTDYLDDVSGTYREEYDNDFQAYAAQPGTNIIDPNAPFRGNQDGANDWYIYHGAGLKINFSPTKKTFNAPSVSSRLNTVPVTPTSEAPPTAQKDSLEKQALSEQTNNFYYTFINWPSIAALEKLKYRLDTLQIELAMLEQRRQLDQISSVRAEEENKLRQYELSSSQIQKDTLLSSESKKARLETIKNLKSHSEAKIDSLSQKEAVAESQLKALAQQKQNLDSPSNDGQDSIAFLREFRWISKFLPFTKDSALIWGTRPLEFPVQEPVIPADSLRPFPPPKEPEKKQPTFTYREGQEPDQSSRTDSLLQVLIELQSQSVIPEEREDITVEAEVDTVKKSRFPIRIFSGRSEREKRSKTKPWDDSKRKKEAPSESVETQIDRSGENEESQRTATILGLSNLGLNIAEIFDKKGKIDTLKIASDSTLSSPNEPYDEIPAYADPISERDTVFLEVPGKNIAAPTTVDIYFDINKSQPSLQELEKIQPLAEYIKQNPDKHLFLTGFADNTGSLSYNLRLIQERIDHLMEYLVQELGISPSQIHSETGGKIVRDYQKGPNPKDRRVEVKIIL